MTIGDLAKNTGLAPKTIRFYEDKGLLPRPSRSASGYRLYGPDDVRRLTFLRRARALGFSLTDARRLLQAAEHETCSTFEGELSPKIDLKLQEVDRLLAQLADTRAELAAMAKRLSETECNDCQQAALACYPELGPPGRAGIHVLVSGHLPLRRSWLGVSPIGTVSGHLPLSCSWLGVSAIWKGGELRCRRRNIPTPAGVRTAALALTAKAAAKGKWGAANTAPHFPRLTRRRRPPGRSR